MLLNFNNSPKKRTNKRWEEKIIARKKRLWYPGEVLHIMNRGANHQRTFSDEKDYQYMEQLIKQTQQKYEFEIHAYCFMTNHYHLLLETKNDHISNIMKQIDQQYTRYYNRKYHRDGALFRGRFKSCEVNSDNYFLQTSRYISLNPVKAQMVSKPEQYRWSSFRTYIGNSKDEITSCGRTLDYFKENGRTMYRNYVEEGMKEDEFEQICSDIGD